MEVAKKRNVVDGQAGDPAPEHDGIGVRDSAGIRRKGRCRFGCLVGEHVVRWQEDRRLREHRLFGLLEPRSVGGAETRVVGVHRAHHHVCARGGRCCSDPLRLEVAHRERFLTQDRLLARLTCGDHLRGVDLFGPHTTTTSTFGFCRTASTSVVAAAPHRAATRSATPLSMSITADDVEPVGDAGEHWQVDRLRDQARAQEPDTQRTTHEGNTRRGAPLRRTWWLTLRTCRRRSSIDRDSGAGPSSVAGAWATRSTEAVEFLEGPLVEASTETRTTSCSSPFRTTRSRQRAAGHPSRPGRRPLRSGRSASMCSRRMRHSACTR